MPSTGSRKEKISPLDVFINCPFDETYRPLFAAIIFTITASGYRPRCALEEENGADIRLDKLCRIVGQCQRSIHDLSRVEVDTGTLPRFNMPFELGMVIGAKRFGGKVYQYISALIMVHEAYQMPAFLSDLAGNDPHAHRNQVANVIKIVRNFLSTYPGGVAPLPGPAALLSDFEEFQSKLPVLAEAIRHTPEEIDPFRSYPEYTSILSGYLKNLPPL